MSLFTKLFSLSKTELSILLEAWVVFLKWDWLISFTQYSNWQGEIANLTSENDAVAPENKADEASLSQLTLVIKLSEKVAKHHIRKMNCLRRCLTQKQMLQKRGYPTRMHIGVAIDNETLKAHAWLTYQGKIINDSDDVTTRYGELKAKNEQAILRSFK
jgi:hypothetical protein